MPFSVRRQACTDSQGNKGSWVVFNTDTGRKRSCHQTRGRAQAAARAANAGSPDV